MATVFELLDREWHRLRNDPATAHHLHDICHLADNAHTLADVETYVRRAGPADADNILLALVTRVVDHDDALAARVLLQLLIPGTRNMARRWWALGDPDERAAAAVTAVYTRIRTYPLARRPGRIAANILLDAQRELRRTATHTTRTTVTPVPDPTTHHPHTTRDMGEPDPHPAIELTHLLQDAVDHHLIHPDDADLIARTRIHGQRVVDIAHHRHVGTRTLWDRRHRAEHTLTTTYRNPTHATATAS
jgi:hypothetical protein